MSITVADTGEDVSMNDARLTRSNGEKQHALITDA